MRILFAWEMGHNFGHVSQIAVIARAIKKIDKKADIWMALKTPDAAKVFAPKFADQIVQAPFFPPERKKQQPPHTYAEGLLPCGYQRPEFLADLIKQWRAMFDQIKPDILIVQAAPTALIATRGTTIKTMNFGLTFDVPHLDVPMPTLRYWDKTQPDLAAREQKILETINTALKQVKLKPLENVAEGITSEKEFLCAFRELDHYPKRPDTDYYGPLYVTDTGEKISWNKTSKKRVFAYITPGPPSFMAVIESLRHAPKELEGIVVTKDISQMMIDKLQTPNLRILTKPARLDGLLKDCDLAITNANPALGAAVMMAGVPALMLPLHIEQYMSARAFGRAKLGLSLLGDIKPKDITRKIIEILSKPEFAANAKAMAKKYKAMSPDKTAAKIAKEILAFK